MPVITRTARGASAVNARWRPTNKRVERAPERQNAKMGRGSSFSNCANAAISSGDW